MNDNPEPLPLPVPRWQLRLTNGDLIAGDYEWMDGGTDPDPDPDRIDWEPIENYLEEGEAAEAWWMVPTKVVPAPLPKPDEDED